MSKFTDAYDKSIDWLLGQAFQFWVWLGKALDVSIELPVIEIKGPPGETVYKDRPETVQTLVELTNANAELKAENVDLRYSLAQATSDGFALQDQLKAAGHIKGDNRPNRKKLTKSEVSLIRDLHRSGTRQVDIAETFDVNPATISRIVRGQYYSTVAA